MGPRTNLFDVATLICMGDQRPRVLRAVRKRLGTRPSLASVMLATIAMGGWSFAIACVGLYAVIYLVYELLVPADGNKRQIEFQVVTAAAFCLFIPVAWIGLRMNELRTRLGKSARLRGLSERPDPAAVHERVEQWAQFIGTPAAGPARHQIIECSLTGKWIYLCRLATLCVVVSSALALRTNILVLNMFYPIVIVGSVWFQRRCEKRVTSAFAASLEQHMCPECGYSLRAMVTKQERESGMVVGPKRCSECGTRWPLVPPPLFVPPDPGATEKLAKVLPRLKQQS